MKPTLPTLPPGCVYGLLAWVEACAVLGLDKTVTAAALTLGYAWLARSRGH